MTRSSWSRVKTVLRRLSHQSPKIYFHQTTSEWAIFYIFTTSSIIITLIQSLHVVIVVFWRYLIKSTSVIFHVPLRIEIRMIDIWIKKIYVRFETEK